MTRAVRQNVAILAAFTAIALVVLVISRPAHAQGTIRPKGEAEAHFSTKIGSFKLLGSEDDPLTGHLDMKCKGTILVSGVDTPPVTTGSMKLEYTYAPLKKYAYHGDGGLVIDVKDGKWRSLQWFGTDLEANFKGRGKIRLVGEFDKDLNTGFYWTTDATKKEYWPANNVMEKLVPPFPTAGMIGSTAPSMQPAKAAK